MKKQFLLLCTSALVVLSACSKAGERGETGPQGPQGLPGKDLVAKPLFSFDTSGNGIKAVKIASATFKTSNTTVANIVADIVKAGTEQLKEKALTEEGKTLNLNIKELTSSTTAASNAIGIVVPFSGEGIQAGSTITLRISGMLSGSTNAVTANPSVGIAFATKTIASGFSVTDIEGFSVITTNKQEIASVATSLPISKGVIKALFLQITDEGTDANKKLFEAGSSQVDIAISVKDGQHIDTRHIILKGVAAT